MSGASELYFAGAVTNTKTIEALVSGTVAFVSGAANNSGGTILASAAGARVVMNDATISGGTLRTSAARRSKSLVATTRSAPSPSRPGRFWWPTTAR